MAEIEGADYDRAKQALEQGGPCLSAVDRIVLNLIETASLCDEPVAVADLALARAISARWRR